MKLLPDVECIEDAGLFIWRPRGVLDEPLVNKSAIFGENCGRPIEFTGLMRAQASRLRKLRLSLALRCVRG
jgi:hypothetical protein